MRISFAVVRRSSIARSGRATYKFRFCLEASMSQFEIPTKLILPGSGFGGSVVMGVGVMFWDIFRFFSWWL
jgi:hypothetical protein